MSIIRRFTLFAGLLMALLGLSGCAETYRWNQKITLVIDTPNGVKSGSSVLSVYWRNATGGTALQMGKFSAEGEAAFVDLGGGRYLFALIKGAAGWAELSILPENMRRASFVERGDFIDQTGKSAEFHRKLPLLVTFDDITKPETVKRVDPDNLAATFGAGYGLKSITLEITDEPVTKGRVEQVLGWLGEISDHQWKRLTSSQRDVLSTHVWKAGAN